VTEIDFVGLGLRVEPTRLKSSRPIACHPPPLCGGPGESSDSYFIPSIDRAANALGRSCHRTRAIQRDWRETVGTSTRHGVEHFDALSGRVGGGFRLSSAVRQLDLVEHLAIACERTAEVPSAV